MSNLSTKVQNARANLSHIQGNIIEPVPSKDWAALDVALDLGQMGDEFDVQMAYGALRFLAHTDTFKEFLSQFDLTHYADTPIDNVTNT